MVLSYILYPLLVGYYRMRVGRNPGDGNEKSQDRCRGRGVTDEREGRGSVLVG